MLTFQAESTPKERPNPNAHRSSGEGSLREAAFLAVFFPPAGRGGSVSRRDHNQAYRRPPPTHRRNQQRRNVPTRTPAALRERVLSEKPPSLPYPYPQQVAAALSAVVTVTKPIGDRPHSQAEPTKKERPSPNARRSSGGVLSEKPPSSPYPSPQQVAAALSAVVTIIKPIGDRLQLIGGTNKEETSQPKHPPLFERGFFQRSRLPRRILTPSRSRRLCQPP